MQGQIAKQLFEQSDPLRRALIGLNMGFLGIEPTAAPTPPTPASPQNKMMTTGRLMDAGAGDEDKRSNRIMRMMTQKPQIGDSSPIQPISFGDLNVSALPQFQVGKNILESQFKRARESTLASGATGGALVDLLAKGETDRAKSLGTLGAELTQQQLNQALGLATGGVGQAQTGLQSVMAAQAQKAAAESQAKGAKGQGAGAIAAAAITKNPAAAASAASDRRLKTNIKKMFESDGIQFYTYNYLTDDTMMAGVMADEVDHIPGAVFDIAGIQHVNYEVLI